MKHLLLLILSALLPALALAERPADVNPVYIGALLIDEPALPDMEKLCEYYGFTAAPEEDGIAVYTRSDGATIRLRTDGDPRQPRPTVEVRTDDPVKSTRAELLKINYVPSSQAPNQYYKGTTLANRHSVATLTGDKTASLLIFTKLKTR